MAVSSSSNPRKTDIPKMNIGPADELPEGFPFDSKSPIRQLTEPAVYFLYPYIAGLTIMDDRIAAAVDAHSTFREHPWRRLFGTIDSLILLVFGSDDETVKAARRIYAIHQKIQGKHRGQHYDANDTDAQVWVMASGFEALKKAKARWTLAGFTKQQETELYNNFLTFGQLFGIDPVHMPKTIKELDTYWNRRINDSHLLRSSVSREMTKEIFRYKGQKLPRALARLGHAVYISMLDPRLQEQAGLSLTASEQRAAAFFDRFMRSTYGLLPQTARRQAIPAYLAIRRQLKSLGKSLRSSLAE